jgi:hypothetical protein
MGKMEPEILIWNLVGNFHMKLWSSIIIINTSIIGEISLKKYLLRAIPFNIKATMSKISELH